MGDGRSRRSAPHHVLAEGHVLAEEHSTRHPWRPPGPGRERGPPRPAWSSEGSGSAAARNVLIGILVATVVAGAGWVQTTGFWSPVGIGSIPGTAGTTGVPSPGHEASPDPLGTPAPVALTSPAWAPLQTQTDAQVPVTWDPCRPIHYVTRPDGAPAGAQVLLQQALVRASTATGLQFIDDGATTEETSPTREAFQPQRYGDRWAPVLITYNTTTEVPDLAASVIAQAGPATVTTTVPSPWSAVTGRVGASVDVYVSGVIQIDAAEVATVLSHPGGQEMVRAVFEHEVGHLLGLAHVDDPTQLMYPQAGTLTDYAAGDLTGLAALGTGACTPTL